MGEKTNKHCFTSQSLNQSGKVQNENSSKYNSIFWFETNNENDSLKASHFSEQLHRNDVE